MSTVQQEIDHLVESVIRRARAAATVCNRSGDTEWLLREIEDKMRAKMVEIVWATEAAAGISPGSMETLCLDQEGNARHVRR